MTQQEIKENMTQGTWVVNPGDWDNRDFGVFDSEKYIGGRFIIGRTNGNFGHTKYDTEAIVHAINNTYGKGINPESVPEMYNTLQGVVLILKMLNEPKTAQDIQEILNKVTI